MFAVLSGTVTCASPIGSGRVIFKCLAIINLNVTWRVVSPLEAGIHFDDRIRVSVATFPEAGGCGDVVGAKRGTDSRMTKFHGWPRFSPVVTFAGRDAARATQNAVAPPIDASPSVGLRAKEACATP